MEAAAAKGLTSEVVQNFVGPICTALTPTTRVEHPAKTDNHKPTKRATIQGFLLKTARTRKKNRRDVKTIVRE